MVHYNRAVLVKSKERLKLSKTFYRENSKIGTNKHCRRLFRVEFSHQDMKVRKSSLWTF